jgi:putative SOS response-associated peptidase YedK
VLHQPSPIAVSFDVRTRPLDSATRSAIISQRAGVIGSRVLGETTGASKQPYCFEVREWELFAFAALWDGWKDPSGKWIKTCSVLTTIPNAGTAPVHDRMPVILDPDSYDLWLDPGMQNVAAISDLLKPYDARLMSCYPVSTRRQSRGER